MTHMSKTEFLRKVEDRGGLIRRELEERLNEGENKSQSGLYRVKPSFEGFPLCSRYSYREGRGYCSTDIERYEKGQDVLSVSYSFKVRPPHIDASKLIWKAMQNLGFVYEHISKRSSGEPKQHELTEEDERHHIDCIERGRLISEHCEGVLEAFEKRPGVISIWPLRGTVNMYGQALDFETKVEVDAKFLYEET